MSVIAPGTQAPEFTLKDEDGIVQEVAEMRRAIDLLVSREEIDPSRLAYVGFS